MGFGPFMDGIIEVIMNEELDFDFNEVSDCSQILKLIESGQKNSNSPIPTPISEEDMFESETVTSPTKDTQYKYESSPDTTFIKYRSSTTSISTQCSNNLSFL